MKKHIIGFAIFSLIIGSAIFVQCLFGSTVVTVPAVSENDSDYSPAKNSCWKMKRKISMDVEIESQSQATKKVTYKLNDVAYDTINNVVIGQVELFWNGEGKKPDAIAMDLNLFSPDNALKNISVGSSLLMKPFAEGDSVTRSFAVQVNDKKLINPRNNYYAAAQLSLIQNNFENSGGEMKGVVTRILVNQDEKLAQSSPVMMIFDK